ncbi:hypothetical protein N7490_006713 [Penicillium lividum]|nr:hypothetical protein N7490_006713 [Penicillium lividum]
MNSPFISAIKQIRITDTLTLTAARAFERPPPPFKEFTFVYVSGEGTMHKPCVSTPLFSQVKGKTEVDLINLQTEAPRLRPIFVRPTFIDASAHNEINPWISPQNGLRHAIYCRAGAIHTTYLDRNT